MDADFFRKHVRGLAPTLDTNAFDFSKGLIADNDTMVHLLLGPEDQTGSEFVF
jgi:hypothetical protein